MLWNVMDDKAQKLSLICHFSHLSQEMWQTTFLLLQSGSFAAMDLLPCLLQDVEPHLCKWEWRWPYWPYWCNRSQGISAAASFWNAYVTSIMSGLTRAQLASMLDGREARQIRYQKVWHDSKSAWDDQDGNVWQLQLPTRGLLEPFPRWEHSGWKKMRKPNCPCMASPLGLVLWCRDFAALL